MRKIILTRSPHMITVFVWPASAQLEYRRTAFPKGSGWPNFWYFGCNNNLRELAEVHWRHIQKQFGVRVRCGECWEVDLDTGAVGPRPFSKEKLVQFCIAQVKRVRELYATRQQRTGVSEQYGSD